MTTYLRNVTLIIAAALVIFALSCSSANALSFELEYNDDGTGCIFDNEQNCYVDNDAYHGAYGYVYDDYYDAYVYYNGDTVIICDCEVCEYVKEGNEIIIADDGWLLAEEGQEDDGGDDEYTEEYEVWDGEEESVDECDWTEEDVVDDVEDEEDWIVEEYEDETDDYAVDEAPITKAEKNEDNKVVKTDTKTEKTRSTGNNSKVDGYGVAEVAPEGADESEPTEYRVSESPKYTGTESTGYTEDDTAGYYEDEPTDYSVTDSTEYDLSESAEYDTDGSIDYLDDVDSGKTKSPAARATMVMSVIAGLAVAIGRWLKDWI